MFADLTVRELLDRFSSSDPTPGGGSAAALAGALGASLLAMVAAMPKTKSGAPEERTALDAARTELLQLRDRLLDLVDRDTQAYEQVVGAYRLPKGTDEEKAIRKQAIQSAMVLAAETPLETMHVCRRVIETGRTVLAFGNRNAISDIGVGSALAGSGIQGAMLNVAVNLDGIADEATRKSLAVRTVDITKTLHHDAAAREDARDLMELFRKLYAAAGIQPPQAPPPPDRTGN